MNFQQKLDKIVKKNNSLVCVGLDPELEKLPKHLQSEKNTYFIFNKFIIDATHDLVCAYKPNIAFYEADGLDGLLQLKLTLSYLQKNYPQIPIILDAKRADISNTNKMYARAMFDFWMADAVTVYPYLGLDSVVPFLKYKDKLIILLVRTSNPDAKMFQDLKVGNDRLFFKIAKEIKKWKYNNIGIFVGATYPEELKKVRNLFPDSVFLSAGIGAQKAEIMKTVKAGIDKNKGGIIFNASRSIIYASSGKDFAEKARQETIKLREIINNFR